MLYESIEHAYDTVVRLEIKFVLKMVSNAWGIQRIPYYKTNRESLIVLCSIVKHLGSG